jgi:diguanylate cyclase (GGDEF)-like protein
LVNLLDVRTVMIGYLLSAAVCALILSELWRQNHRRYSGLGLWLADFWLQVTGLLIITLGNSLPKALPVLLGNGLIIAGTILLYRGLETFIGRRGPWLQNLLLLSAFLAVQAYFLFRTPSLTARNINLSIGLMVICGECVFLLLRRTPAPLRPTTSMAGLIFAAYILSSLLRIIADSFVPSGSDFFQSDIYDTLVLLAYQLLFIALTFSLLLMVNRRLILDVENDIRERRRVEAILQLRVTLWEYAGIHSVEELMQKTLDEIEGILQSPVGFYHFVEADQTTLALQAWSTRTLCEFCRAEGRGRHYPLDQAGVWADSVRVQKPVIHNSYGSLPGRKGLPPGHASIDRELVVPTLRAGRVVSVLGVGNKASDYDEQDARLLYDIADIVWVIIERKRADEEILRLQERLRELALRDPLTGLYNRHYIGETLTRELARAAREKYPVSFIMIDIDNFKRVNDTYGHAAGDALLQDLGVQLLRNSRASDILYRYGGEEFLAVLPKAKAELAFTVAEKWRRIFSNSAVPFASGGSGATISCGIAEFPRHGEAAADLIAHADRAMYQSKEAGRNRSTIWKGDEEPSAPEKSAGAKPRGGKRSPPK